tara:strand:+ start:1278 stop:1565 length:288 start_codon:yes stop_codon:yes gene_type:complete
MIVEHKTIKRESWSVDVRFIPILYTGVLYAQTLNHIDEAKLEEFKAKLMTKANGFMPKLTDMSSTTTGLCEITQADHVSTAQVWFEWEALEWRAE